VRIFGSTFRRTLDSTGLIFNLPIKNFFVVLPYGIHICLFSWFKHLILHLSLSSFTFHLFCTLFPTTPRMVRTTSILTHNETALVTLSI
jgi:hypothetical protein